MLKRRWKMFLKNLNLRLLTKNLFKPASRMLKQWSQIQTEHIASTLSIFEYPYTSIRYTSLCTEVLPWLSRMYAINLNIKRLCVQHDYLTVTGSCQGFGCDLSLTSL